MPSRICAKASRVGGLLYTAPIERDSALVPPLHHVARGIVIELAPRPIRPPQHPFAERLALREIAHLTGRPIAESDSNGRKDDPFRQRPAFAIRRPNASHLPRQELFASGGHNADHDVGLVFGAHHAAARMSPHFSLWVKRISPILAVGKR